MLIFNVLFVKIPVFDIFRIPCNKIFLVIFCHLTCFCSICNFQIKDWFIRLFSWKLIFSLLENYFTSQIKCKSHNIIFLHYHIYPLLYPAQVCIFYSLPEEGLECNTFFYTYESFYASINSLKEKFETKIALDFKVLFHHPFLN